MKRFIGVIIALLPFAFIRLIPSLIAQDNMTFFRESTTLNIMAWGALIAGSFISLVNFALSFCRPYWLTKKGIPIEQQKFISGFPLVATLLLMFVNIPLYPLLTPAIIATIFLLLDTGSPLCFVICTWRDNSLWGENKF